MQRFMLLAVVGLVLAFSARVDPAAARGVNPVQLTTTGWDCFLPPPQFNPKIHCAPPGQLERIVSGEAVSGMFLAFDTDDIDAEDAALLGSERLIRADKFRGQPCPTDPPSYEYSSLFPRFGWNYYICHTFDSPW